MAKTILDSNGIIPGGSQGAGSGSVTALIQGVRRDADTTLGNDGDTQSLNLNSVGRLKVSVMPADTETIGGTITANGGIVAMECKRISTISVALIAAPSFSGHNVSFEVSNNSTTGSDGNWFAVQAVRSNSNTIETSSGSLSATPAYMWNINVATYQWFRVRATAHTSGTAGYSISPSIYASEPIPAAQISGTQPVSIASLPTLATGTNIIGQVRQVCQSAANGSLVAKIEAAATTNATSTKASAGVVYQWQFTNVAAYPVYIKFYNKASAPTVGTDVPILKVAVPAGAMATMPHGPGVTFSTGIAYAITKLVADSDTTVVAAGDVVGHFLYA